MSNPSIQPKKRGTRRLEKLNPQQQLFVHHLLADPTFNTVAAARKAGYKSPSTSVTQLMKNPIVNAALGKALGDRLERLKVTQDRVVYELAAIAFSDPRELFDDDGKPLRIKSLPDHIARAIGGIKRKDMIVGRDKETGDAIEEKHTEIKLWNKIEALTLLGKHLGMFVDRISVEGMENVPPFNWDDLYSRTHDGNMSDYDDPIDQKIRSEFKRLDDKTTLVIPPTKGKEQNDRSLDNMLDNGGA